LKINKTDNTDDGFLKRVAKNLRDLKDEMLVKTSEDYASVTDLRDLLISY